MFIQSPLNYTGGKYKTLDQIMSKFPQNIDTFYDVFCGGANVAINSKAKHIVCIDKCEQLISLFEWLQTNDYDNVISQIEEQINYYHLSDTYKYGYEYYNTTGNKGVSNYNKESYYQLRNDYNKTHSDVLFFLLIIFGFNNQIRFNKNGEFNLPVGKRDFNKNIRKKLEIFMEALHRKDIKFYCMDFRDIDISHITSNDFIYCDPPYILGNASYNETGGWTKQDDIELLKFFDKCNDYNIKFAVSNVLQHKGQRNDTLIDWINKNHYVPFRIKINYNNSNYQKSDKESTTKEVLVMNK